MWKNLNEKIIKNKHLDLASELKNLTQTPVKPHQLKTGYVWITIDNLILF